MADDRRFHEFVLGGIGFALGSIVTGWVIRQIGSSGCGSADAAGDDPDLSGAILSDVEQQDAIDRALAEEGYE